MFLFCDIIRLLIQIDTLSYFSLMILTGSQIVSEVNHDSIIIEPFATHLLNPNSYNYRLGNRLTVLENEILDPKEAPKTQTFTIPSEGFVLLPHQLYLGHTLEKIGSKAFTTSLIGRSSVGRLGLFLQITADLGQLGNAHQWTLELKVVQPLRVYAGMKIGQVSFWKTTGDVNELYLDGYTRFDNPHHSRYHEVMETKV